MEFLIAQSDFSKALSEALRGYVKGSATDAGLEANDTELALSLPRRTVRVLANVNRPGAADIPIHVMFWLKRITTESSDPQAHIQVVAGELKINLLSRKDPKITVDR